MLLNNYIVIAGEANICPSNLQQIVTWHRFRDDFFGEIFRTTSPLSPFSRRVFAASVLGGSVSW